MNETVAKNMTKSLTSGELRHRMSDRFLESGCEGDAWNSGLAVDESGIATLETGRVSLNSFELKPVGFGADSVVRTVVYLSCKRIIDVLLSLIAIVLLSPVFIVAAVMIKLCDRGPVFFSQERVGKGGLRFRCFKFRSMIRNAETLQRSLTAESQHADPRTFKIANDPRITPPGRFLRRFSIDELPQILNVFLGEMSIVGPRPALPQEVALYSDSDCLRLAVKPGLTCTWQVSGRSRLPFPEQVKLDLDYIQRRSFLLDLTLIARTVPAVLSGDGAV